MYLPYQPRRPQMPINPIIDTNHAKHTSASPTLLG